MLKDYIAGLSLTTQANTLITQNPPGVGYDRIILPVNTNRERWYKENLAEIEDDQPEGIGYASKIVYAALIAPQQEEKTLEQTFTDLCK